MGAKRSVVKQGGIHCYAGRLRLKAEAGSALRQDRHAGNLCSRAGARDTGGRCMVPGSCKGVFPKRLTDKDRRIESWTARDNSMMQSGFECQVACQQYPGIPMKKPLNNPRTLARQGV